MDTQTHTPPEASGSQALKLLRQKMKDGTLGDVIRDWKWILSFTKGRWFRILVYTLLGILSSALALPPALPENISSTASWPWTRAVCPCWQA